MITEKQFSEQVEDLLKTFHWRWCHFRPARTMKGWRTSLSGDKGFPDYIAARPPRLLIFELKSDKGRLSSEQKEWLYILQQLPAPVECYLFRPSDFETIVEILR